LRKPAQDWVDEGVGAELDAGDEADNDDRGEPEPAHEASVRSTATTIRCWTARVISASGAAPPTPGHAGRRLNEQIER